MRTVGAGANIKKSGSVAELETENRMLREANESAGSRINELEIMLDESREQAAGLQAQLDESREQAAGLQAQLDESREQAAGLQAQLDESREQAAGLQAQLDEERKAKASKEKNTGK